MFWSGCRTLLELIIAELNNSCLVPSIRRFNSYSKIHFWMLWTLLKRISTHFLGLGQLENIFKYIRNRFIFTSKIWIRYTTNMIRPHRGEYDMDMSTIRQITYRLRIWPALSGTASYYRWWVSRPPPVSRPPVNISWKGVDNCRTLVLRDRVRPWETSHTEFQAKVMSGSKVMRLIGIRRVRAIIS